MGRPKVKELTERELEVMQVFWEVGAITAADAREKMSARGIDRAYVTVANLVRILVEKGYLKATNEVRPFTYVPCRSFKDVSGTFVGDMLKRVFGGSREQMLAQLLGGTRTLSVSEKTLLKQVLEENS